MWRNLFPELVETTHFKLWVEPNAWNWKTFQNLGTIRYERALVLPVEMDYFDFHQFLYKCCPGRELAELFPV